ncbi:hypothetical protein A2973_04905 [Candidatus Gottesmanbacteria bacterium RIFCSPLOWO2_01_FULL_49_10]|uniref:Bacterial sugar transferase domain-containing protein n=1 Tax=Candidatus Gottesmanbacteria bacterium RIFCSPLOWO2_01_FULL_49_10 TaxID=1798396 RepID=A0A1F6AWH7_9BACT|nr:MAG: hypothetical protein A2973_04905 [Candidatus Gottesmanbacteria bacterium RIFCSPLOWO2_01_FULL_49_10]
MNILRGPLYHIFVALLVGASLPLQIGIGVLVAVVTGLPILYRQKRMGLGGKPFVLYKFRTMVWGSDTLQDRYHLRNEAKGPVFKIHDDPRHTPLGRFLSHTGLDELPQIWNVLTGDMALIGPRPLPVAEAGKLKAWQRARHRIKPGIISPWILEGYHSRTFDEWMKSDIAYGKKKSPGTDVRLLLRAVVFVARLFLHELSRFL